MRNKKQKNKNIIILLTLALTVCLAVVGCGKEAQGNSEDEHNVILPVVAQGGEDVQKQEEEAPYIPVVSEEEAYKTMLVNITHPIAKDYTMELVTVGGYKMDARAAEDMRQMLEDARAEGLDPIICSAYRSVDRQITLFNNQVKKQQGFGLDYDAAFEKAKTVVAYPGTSEHHTGLAADIVAKSHQVLDDSQQNTAEQKWLMENSWKYGYILRYPSDKCELTKIIYEPWHYRYVGKEVAQYLYENDLCLEEYWLQLADMNPEKYGYILEEITPEQIVPKQQPQTPPAQPPVEQPVEQAPQDTVILDDSFTKEQQEAAAGQLTDESIIEDTDTVSDETNNSEVNDSEITNDTINNAEPGILEETPSDANGTDSAEQTAQ